jgi:hypothetical protein
MIEHRWSGRLNIDHRALLVSDRNQIAVGKIRNISLYGMYVETTSRLPENACVQVQFVLPGDRQETDRHVSALVVHQHDDGVGLIINSSHHQAAARIRSLLHYCKNKRVGAAAGARGELVA